MNRFFAQTSSISYGLFKRLHLFAAATLFTVLLILPSLIQAAEIGVYVGNQPEDLPPFEQWLGRPVDGVLAYTGDRSWGDMDPGWQIGGYLGRTGRKLYWSIPMSPNAGSADANLQTWREIAAGTHDSKYRGYAQAILNSRAGDNEPIYVRTSWELGGEWFWWTAAAQQDPAAFREAFRRFAMNFHNTSNRFKIIWDFVSDRGAVEQWYPGDDAVDIISQDVYWNPQWSSNDPVEAFNVYRNKERGLDWAANFAGQRNKQIAISEWGVTGNNAGPFIDAMKNWIDSHNVTHSVYWDSQAAYDGKLSLDRWPDTTAAFRRNFGQASTPNPGTGPQPNQYYQLVARHSNKCLDVAAVSSNNGASFLQYTCHNGQNQQFKFEDAGNGFYRVTPRHSGKAMDLNNYSTADGARVIQWDYFGGQNQQWRLEQVGGGYYRLIVRHSGKCLDVSGVSLSNGAALTQWACIDGQPNQQWMMRPIQ